MDVLMFLWNFYGLGSTLRDHGTKAYKLDIGCEIYPEYNIYANPSASTLRIRAMTCEELLGNPTERDNGT